VSAQSEHSRRITIATLREMKRNEERFVCLTAYDTAFAKILDQAGVDLILVGDSLGMVVQGHETTIPVTMDDMVYHCSLAARGISRAMLVADMPFLSYATPDQALANAARLMQQGGAQMVKLEGGDAQQDVVKHLSGNGVPVCAHIGLKPQSIHKMGAYRVQGRQKHAAETMLYDAETLQKAGADMLLLECVPMKLAQEIVRNVDVPVIGIGAGPYCDAQILVLHDVLGITPGQVPKFSQNFMQQADSIADAIAAYVQAVREGNFPAPQHCFD